MRVKYQVYQIWVLLKRLVKIYQIKEKRWCLTKNFQKRMVTIYEIKGKQWGILLIVKNLKINNLKMMSPKDHAKMITFVT